MVMEWMDVGEIAVGFCQKGSIMKTNGVWFGSTTPGIAFATMSHLNSNKAMNSTMSNMDMIVTPSLFSS